MIVYLEFKYVSNYNFSQQPTVKAGTRLKSNLNQDKGPQKQDLRQWMNEKEKNDQKSKETIQKVCKKIT